nr:myticofensin B1 [Mytilus coruscus]
MKYFVVVLVLSLCVAGLHAKKKHMAGYNFDQFCPHSQLRCHFWCRSWGFDRGVCEGPGNTMCWCYWSSGPMPSLKGKSKIANEK